MTKKKGGSLSARTLALMPGSAAGLSAVARKRLAWLVVWRQEGSATAVSRRLGIARSTLYAIRRRFERENTTGLEDRSRRPHRLRSPNWPRKLVSAVERLHRSHPRSGPVRIARLLREEGMESSASTIGRILRTLNPKIRNTPPAPLLDADVPERGPPRQFDGADLRAVRMRLGLTQAALATELGVTRSTVNRWERRKGRIPRVVFLAVAHILQVLR